jgi:hypothetical protein
MAKSSWRRIVSASRAGCCLFPLVAPALAATPPRGAAPPSSPAPRLRVEVSCSTTNPGVAIATLRWEGPTARTSRSGIAPGPVQEVADAIDVATSRTGFNRLAYVTVWPPERPARPGIGPGATTRPELDPLMELHMSLPPSRSGRQTRPALGPVQPSFGGTSMLQTGGLEAGVNYFWRVRSQTARGEATSPVVQVQGRSCPVDHRQSPKQ